ncbi:hypothetical protein KAR91_17075, partial [Candidatus Pacearchaeota archaeon]|nr:hypothetical protein [Candidatus Pacearchaeota archaeon]
VAVVVVVAMKKEKSRFTLRREALKKEAAKYYGVSLDSLTEYRGWVPTAKIEQLKKYVRRLK